MAVVQKCFRDATEGITKIKDEVQTALGKKNPLYLDFCKKADNMKEMVEFGDEVLV